MTKKNINRIKNIITNHKDTLKQDYSIRQIGLFGSYIRGEQKKNSDLDILVDFAELPGLFKFIHLENYLKSILKLKVDLVMKTSLKPAIGKNILKEVIYL